MTEELWAKLGPQWRSILLISEVVRDEKREAGILNYIPTVPVSRKLRLGARRVDPNPKGITARGDAAIAADLGVTPDELRDRLRTPPPQRLIEGGTKASAERINMTTWEQIKEAARLARKRGETIPTVLVRRKPETRRGDFAEHVCDYRCGREAGHHAWPSPRRVDPDPKGITARGDAALAADLGVCPAVLRDRMG